MHFILHFQGTAAQIDVISNPTRDMLLLPVPADLLGVRSHPDGVKDEAKHNEDSSTSFSNEDSDLQECHENQSSEHYFGTLAQASIENADPPRGTETLFCSNKQENNAESEPHVISGYKCCKGRHPCVVFHSEEKQKAQVFGNKETEPCNKNILLLTQTAAPDSNYNTDVITKYQTTSIHIPDNKMDEDSTPAVSLNAKHNINRCANSINRNYTCRKCGNTYMLDINLSFHICHFMSSKCYVCNVCGNEFTTIKTMRCHAAYHTGKYQCETCGNYFSAEVHRDVHIRKHTGEKPHICNLCGKTFMYSNSLAYHLNIHSGENSFICDICGHRSFSKGNFERHKASHTKIKPHMCEICGKAFTVNVDLKRHRLTHSNDKNFICDICDKRFKTSAILTNHQRLHTGERPYSCDVCGKKFARNDGLKEHKLTHTGEKRHSCGRCGKQFTWSKGLRKHKCNPVTF
jgi:DNA-directed RNA polymerase subunit RPC12/RpoP